VAPLNFDDPGELTRSLEGADVLYNTYWIRFPRGGTTHDQAVENTGNLVAAAREAGVRRIVHISITGASASSELTYFRGKGQAEQIVKESGLSYAIVRPTLVFGGEDVLINNIAWGLRRFPLFPVFGNGDYPVQPVHVDDLANIAIAAANESLDLTLDAAGPETITYEELIRSIAKGIAARGRPIHVSPRIALLLTRALGLLVRDVVLTRHEIDGLMAGLLVSDSAPTGETRFSDWLSKHGDSLGRRYVSELARHYRR
jgi:NADH dehydrogenase